MTSSRTLDDSRRGLPALAAAALPAVVVAAVLVLVWQLAVALFGIPDYVLPSPLAIVAQLVELPTLADNVLATAGLALLGFAIGAASGLLIAGLLHVAPLAKRGLYPLLVISQNVPTIVLAPLLVLWLGFGVLPKLLVISIYCFFPIAVAALDGLRSADQSRVGYLRMAGASRWQQFRVLDIPSALPSVFSGAKIAAAYAVTGAVIAEWMGSDSGLGHFLLLQKAAFRVDRMFVAIGAIVLIAVILFGIIALLERIVVHWKAAS